MAAGGRRAGGDESVAAALTGGGPSQLGPGGSMRARDISRPREADIARAEELVQISFRPRSRPRPADGQPETGGSSPVAS